MQRNAQALRGAQYKIQPALGSSKSHGKMDENNAKLNQLHETNTCGSDDRQPVEMDLTDSDEAEDSRQPDYASISRPQEPENSQHQTSPKSVHGETSQKYCDSDSNIVCVTNISPAASDEQIRDLLKYLGDIDQVQVYTFNQGPELNFKVCFAKFVESNSATMALHLTSTVFIDRSIVVIPYNQRDIPDRDKVLAESMGFEYATKFNEGFANRVVTAPGGIQLISTTDSRLISSNLPQYPPLPMNTEPTRLEEIRRTLYIGNLDSTVAPEQVLEFFNDIGEVKYIRLAGDSNQPARFAFVEYTHQPSVADALMQNGYMLGNRPVKINHSNNSIVKPQLKVDTEDRQHRDDRPRSRDHGSRDRHNSHRNGDRTRNRDRTRDRDRYSDRDRHYDRHRSPRSHGRSRSPREVRNHGSSRRDKSRDDREIRRRSRDRDFKRNRSRSRSGERSRSKHHKSSSRR